MAEFEAHEDMKGQDHLTLVIEARPEIQVFVAKNEKVSISVTGVRESRMETEQEIVQIPLDCAEQVGNALINIAKKYNAL
ncbi:hypothetical protein ACU4HD_12090 [Cupriavidus basilensis]